jgi:hypothetical protein
MKYFSVTPIAAVPRKTPLAALPFDPAPVLETERCETGHLVSKGKMCTCQEEKNG